MASRAFNRNLLTLDLKLVALEAVIVFGTNGAPLLQQWNPPSGGQKGFYAPAPEGGCEGITAVRKRATGDFVLLLQDGYQRVKGLLPTYKNSAHLGINAPLVEMPAGELADTYPDLTDFNAERLEAGHSGTAVSAAQPTFTVATANFPATVIGLTFTDSAGVSATIIATNGSDTLTLSGLTTPATGAGWTIKAGSTLILNSTILSGARSSTAFTPATFTDGGATWLVNRWVGMQLTDSTGTTFRIQSNTATALTLQSVSQGVNPTTGAYVISNTVQPGTEYTVTGTALVAGAPTGTGAANTFTPSAHVNWAAGIFAGMYLVDPNGVYWFITTNSTTALTVASNGGNTTPASGASWSIVAVAAAASIEFTTAKPVAAAPTVAALTAAAQVFTGTAHTLTGTNSAPAFTGAAPGAAFNNTPVFSGTGLTAAGQVLTSTDNQTMTLNQCAGMFLISATGNVVEIVSNTAVVGAPAVLTVRGKATTDAGVYYIFQGATPSGSVAAPVLTMDSYTPAGTNGTSAVTGTLTAGAITETLADPAATESLLLTALLSDSVVKQ